MVYIRQQHSRAHTLFRQILCVSHSNLELEQISISATCVQALEPSCPDLYEINMSCGDELFHPNLKSIILKIFFMLWFIKTIIMIISSRKGKPRLSPATPTNTSTGLADVTPVRLSIFTFGCKPSRRELEDHILCRTHRRNADATDSDSPQPLGCT